VHNTSARREGEKESHRAKIRLEGDQPYRNSLMGDMNSRNHYISGSGGCRKRRTRGSDRCVAIEGKPQMKGKHQLLKKNNGSNPLKR